MKFTAIGLTRRRLLASAICTAATGWGVLADPLEDKGSLAKAILSTLISDRESAREIGRTYISEHPDESDPDRLLALMRQGLGLSNDEIVGSTKSRLKNELREAFVRDFENRRVASLHGWTVSLTEARLCALVSAA